MWETETETGEFIYEGDELEMGHDKRNRDLTGLLTLSYSFLNLIRHYPMYIVGNGNEKFNLNFQNQVYIIAMAKITNLDKNRCHSIDLHFL